MLADTGIASGAFGCPWAPDRVYRESVAAFLRLLAAELAARRPGLPPHDLDTGYPLPNEVRRLVGELAVTAISPHDSLSTAYAAALRLVPCSAAGSDWIALQRDEQRPQERGSFYTPRPIARLLVQGALRPLGEGTVPRILDPAVGTGVFLLEAVHVLAERRPRVSPAVVAETCLYGLDLDPLAAELAVLSLWIETGARPAVLAQHIRCADALHEPWNSDGRSFHAIVGNPPWGLAYSAQEREQLVRCFPRSTRGAFDSFKLFLDRAATTTTGTVGMVVPQAVLIQERHADIREVLLEQLDPYAVINLGDGVFGRAAAPACALQFGPKPGPASIFQLDLRRTGAGPCQVPANRWQAGRFPLSSSERVALLDRLQSVHIQLGALSHFYRARDVGINYNRAAVARRMLYTGAVPDDARDLPRYRGRDFARYTAVRPSGWLRHDALALLQPGETLSLDHQTYLLPEKIVFRQTADRIIATLDRGGMAMGRSVIALTADGDISLRPVLACLNSRLLTVLYRTLSGEEGRVLPQVKVGTVLMLPLPATCVEVLQHATRTEARLLTCALLAGETGLLERLRRHASLAWACLEQLADVLLASEGRDPRADAVVDSVVCALYGLTEDEIVLVEEG